jgi:hypothetical protein
LGVVRREDLDREMKESRQGEKSEIYVNEEKNIIGE